MNTDDATEIAQNALHATAAWLQRIGAHADDFAVIDLLPKTALGLCRRGLRNIRTLPAIDDAGVELCEAIAPVVDRMLADLTRDENLAAVTVGDRGARLQLLVVPVAGDLLLRAVDGVTNLPLHVINVQPELH